MTRTHIPPLLNPLSAAGSNHQPPHLCSCQILFSGLKYKQEQLLTLLDLILTIHSHLILLRRRVFIKQEHTCFLQRFPHNFNSSVLTTHIAYYQTTCPEMRLWDRQWMRFVTQTITCISFAALVTSESYLHYLPNSINKNLDLNFHRPILTINKHSRHTYIPNCLYYWLKTTNNCSIVPVNILLHW